MKKLILLFAFGAVAISCTNSPESKANALIKKDLKKYLFKPETYKPVETVVDSAFSPQDDPVLYDKWKKLNDFSKEMKYLEESMKDAKSTMAIYSGPYQSSYDRLRYNDARDEYDEANEKLEKIKEKVKPIAMDFIELINQQPKFIGFKAAHNYRADNNAGNTLIGNSVYIIDPKYETILFSLDKEDYDAYQEVINKTKEHITENQE